MNNTFKKVYETESRIKGTSQTLKRRVYLGTNMTVCLPELRIKQEIRMTGSLARTPVSRNRRREIETDPCLWISTVQISTYGLSLTPEFAAGTGRDER